MEAIRSTQGYKATGLNIIPAEVWELECFNDELLEACNSLSRRHTRYMAERSFLPFLKKGDLGSASNYRGITLMAAGAKTYIRVLLEWLRFHTNPKLRNNQNGIRKERSTVAQILTLRRLVEGIKSKNLPAFITFVDFHKAFDSTHLEGGGGGGGGGTYGNIEGL